MAVSTVLTTKGKGALTLFASSASPAGPLLKYVGIGSGTTAPDVADTTLQTEATTGTWTGYARPIATVTQVTTSVLNDTIQWAASFLNPGTTAPYPWTEAANFDAVSAGNIGIHSVFDVINLQNGDRGDVNLQLQFT
jgi:hypothetical protein